MINDDNEFKDSAKDETNQIERIIMKFLSLPDYKKEVALKKAAEIISE